MQAKAQRSAAREQMGFQADMSNTSYQRAMADMMAAGLNPILAYKQGGASTPSGAMPPVPDIGAAGLSGAAALANVQNIRQQNDNLRAQENLTREQIMRQRLENQAWSVLSPGMRAFVMSGGVSSAAGLAGAGASILGRALGRKAGKALTTKQTPTGPTKRTIDDFLPPVKKKRVFDPYKGFQ